MGNVAKNIEQTFNFYVSIAHGIDDQTHAEPQSDCQDAVHDCNCKARGRVTGQVEKRSRTTKQNRRLIVCPDIT